MKETKKEISSKELCDSVIKGMQEKKANDIVLMDLKHIKNAIADYFIICSGNSDTQIDAISDAVEAFVFKAHHENPWKREGKNNKEWVLIDYVNVVAHVFRKDKREFYAIEELWGDAKTERFENNY